MTTLEKKLKEQGISAYQIALKLSPSGYRSAGFIRKKLQGIIPMSIVDLKNICSFAGINEDDIKFDIYKIKVV